MKKIVFLSAGQQVNAQFCNSQMIQAARERVFEMTVQYKEQMTAEDVQPDLEAEGVFTCWGSPQLTAPVLDKFPKLKIVGHAAGSVKAYASPDLYQRGIRMLSANTVMSIGVAEWSLLMTLLAARDFFASSAYPGRKFMDWKKSFTMSNIRKMTIGCWGFGDTTRHFLKMIAPLMPGRLLIHSSHAAQEDLEIFHAESVSFETLLKESDVLHCLVGVNPKTLYGIGEKELAMMKDHAWVMNAGRSTLVVEDALLQELKSGRLSAALDVFLQEPLPENSPLYSLSLDNLILTPHNAGFPGRDLFVPFLLDQFQKFFRGETPDGEITFQRFQSMTDESLAHKKYPASAKK